MGQLNSLSETLEYMRLHACISPDVLWRYFDDTDVTCSAYNSWVNRVYIPSQYKLDIVTDIFVNTARMAYDKDIRAYAVLAEYQRETKQL